MTGKYVTNYGVYLPSPRLPPFRSQKCCGNFPLILRLPKIPQRKAASASIKVIAHLFSSLVGPVSEDLVLTENLYNTPYLLKHFPDLHFFSIHPYS